MADTSPFSQIAKGHPDWKKIQKQVRAEGHEKAAKRFEPTLANPEIPRDQKIKDLAKQFKDMNQAMGPKFAVDVYDKLLEQYPNDSEALYKAWHHRKKPDALEVAPAKNGPQPIEFSRQHQQDAIDLYKNPAQPVAGNKETDGLNQFYQGPPPHPAPEPPPPAPPWPSTQAFCASVSEYTPQAKAMMLQGLIQPRATADQ